MVSPVRIQDYDEEFVDYSFEQDLPTKVAGRWKLGEILGEGSFGKVYKGTDVQKGTTVAVKNASFDVHRTLQNEIYIYKYLWRNNEDIRGIPRVHYVGKHLGEEVMVMQYLGKSLWNLRSMCGGRLSLKSTFMLALRLLDTLQKIHELGVVHRDIKPDNIVIDAENQGQVYIIDFGLAHFCLNGDGSHILFTKDDPEYSFVGTAEYASLNAHRGETQSRRDDLEALGYTLIALCKGTLPWLGINSTNFLNHLCHVGHVKRKASLTDLCEGMGIEMESYFHEVRKLSFEDTPNYMYLKLIFSHGLRRLGCEDDGRFDWTSP